MILQAKQICKSYTDTQHRVDVLKGLDLSVAEGEAVAVVGPSGAGKSTLLHVLGGLDAPDKGAVIMGGENLYHMNDAERARVRNRQVGFVFQFYHLLPELNALENVMLPMMVMAGRTENMNNIRSRAKVALEAAGMGSRLDHKPSQLSGGEQQRVAIARALINEPRVLLCDEPTGNLDSVTGAGIIDMLMTFAKGASRTLVMVTHDHEVAARCGRVIAMKDGLLAAA